MSTKGQTMTALYDLTSFVILKFAGVFSEGFDPIRKEVDFHNNHGEFKRSYRKIEILKAEYKDGTFFVEIKIPYQSQRLGEYDGAEKVSGNVILDLTEAIEAFVIPERESENSST